jgi:hypothetical protein
MKPAEQEYYYKNFKLKEYVESLGDEARTKFMEWITSIKPFHQRSKCINYELGIDYSNDLFRVGRHLVYLYTNEHGVPFYVGKGDGNRAININNRSSAFKDKLNENGTCRIFAIAFDVAEEDALQIETLVINELLNRGWRLVNSQKVAISNEKLGELREDYIGVIDTLNAITSKAIDYLLGDGDPFGSDGKVFVANASYVKPVAEVGA